MSACSDELEASIALLSSTKEDDVASLPPPLVNTSRSANRFLFAVGKILPFASPLHMASCNERFQGCAGSINRFVFICKRGRRFFVAVSAWLQLKIGKQVFWLPSVKRCPLLAPCICFVSLRASSNELEAPIASFQASQEGNVAS